MAGTPTPWWSKETVAVVTGGNKGIGFEIVREVAERGLTVVLTARDSAKGQAALEDLKAKGLTSIFFHPLDVQSSESAERLGKWLKEQFGGVDILFNNAGVAFHEVSFEEAKRVLQTNYYGQKFVTKALLPLLRPSPQGARIINTSSRSGTYERLVSESLKQQFRNEDNHSEEFADSMALRFLEDVKAGRNDEEGWVDSSFSSGPIYSESKIFLNIYAKALSKSLAKAQPEGHEIYVVSFCPGATGTEALQAQIKAGLVLPAGFPIKKPEEGAETGVWLALLPKEEIATRNGKLFAERTEFDIGTKFSF